MAEFQGGADGNTFASPAAANRPFWANLTAYDGKRYYSWEEVVPQQGAGRPAFVHKDGGLSGTGAGAPAFDPNGSVISVPSIVLLKRAYYDASLDWVYVVVFKSSASSPSTFSVLDPSIGAFDPPFPVQTNVLRAALPNLFHDGGSPSVAQFIFSGCKVQVPFTTVVAPTASLDALTKIQLASTFSNRFVDLIGTPYPIPPDNEPFQPSYIHTDDAGYNFVLLPTPGIYIMSASIAWTNVLPGIYRTAINLYENRSSSTPVASLLQDNYFDGPTGVFQVRRQSLTVPVATQNTPITVARLFASCVQSAPLIRDSSQVFIFGSGSTRLVYPANVNSDGMLLFITVKGATPPSPPTGIPGTWNLLQTITGTNSVMAVYWKLAASEPAFITLTYPAANQFGTALAVSLIGASFSGPESSSTNSSAAFSLSIPITTTQGNDIIFAEANVSGGSISSADPPLTALTQFFGTTPMVAYETQTQPGTYNPTFNSFVNDWIGLAVAWPPIVPAIGNNPIVNNTFITDDSPFPDIGSWLSATLMGN